MIDDWLRMTTTSSGVYSGQIALVSLRLPSLSLPPFLSLDLWSEMVHMAGSLVSGWLGVPRGGISLPRLTAKQTNRPKLVLLLAKAA